ncbi:hypothetical protein AaE_001306 [Aphanomyces astaci]|uniref:DDE Tnp4 domain-containing protein n=1 Tax=Aphanomyces astaci TaxID=112090 RepID=A0A6A5B274_APHAT|nr:hypothetical protein AaE_001306 [Aphanomyces astaci]
MIPPCGRPRRPPYAPFFDTYQYQAGDSGFALGPNMLTPYRLPNPVNTPTGFSTLPKQACVWFVVCEHGNGIWKGRWSSLALLPLDIRTSRDAKTVCDWILACCVLHNIVNRLRNGEDEVPLYVETVRQRTCQLTTMRYCHVKTSKPSYFNIWV